MEYEGKGTFRVEFGTSPGEAYIQYKDKCLKIVLPEDGKIEINGKTFVNGDFTTKGGTVHLN